MNSIAVHKNDEITDAYKRGLAYSVFWTRKSIDNAIAHWSQIHTLTIAGNKKLE